MLKIIEVSKTNEPWKPEGKKWTLYSSNCKVNYDGKETFGKVVTFTENIKVVQGAEFENATMEEKSYTDQNTGEKREYKQFIIKSEKKAWDKDYKKHTFTQEEFENIILRALELAEKYKTKTLESSMIFERYVNNACMHNVKIKNNVDVAKDAMNGKIVNEELEFPDADNNEDNDVPF